MSRKNKVSKLSKESVRVDTSKISKQKIMKIDLLNALDAA